MHGHIFQMSQSNVSKWASLVHGALNGALSPQNLLLARTADELVQRLHGEPSHEEPSHATKASPLFIHDGGARPICRPSDKVDRELYYSGKKKRHTLKNVLIVDEFGSIHFLSDTYEGRVHDTCIADEAGYTLLTASILDQDAGFQGLNLPGVQMMQPKKKPRNGTLTPQEKEENRRISSVRIRIDHGIGDIKRYRIIRDIIRFSCSEFRDMVMEPWCGLHTFRIWLKRKKHFKNQNKS